MIKITFDNISVQKMSHSSGIFIGKKNAHQKFAYEMIVNEVVGSVSGNKNKVRNNLWVKNKEKWEEV